MADKELRAKISADASAFQDALKKSIDQLNRLAKTASAAGEKSPVSQQTLINLKEYRTQLERAHHEMQGLANANVKAPTSGADGGGSVISQIKGMATSFLTFSAAVGLFKAGIDKWKQIQEKLFADRMAGYADTASGLQQGRTRYSQIFGERTNALKGILSLTGKGTRTEAENAELERLLKIVNSGSDTPVQADDKDMQKRLVRLMENLRKKTLSSIQSEIKTNEQAINELEERIENASGWEKIQMMPEQWRTQRNQLAERNSQLTKDFGAIASSPESIDVMRNALAVQADRFAKEISDGADALQGLREKMWSAGEAAQHAKESFEDLSEQQRKAEKDYEKTKKAAYAEEREALRQEHHKRKMEGLASEVQALETKQAENPRRFHRSDTKRLEALRTQIQDEEAKEQERQEKNATKARHDRLRKQIHDARVRRRQARRNARNASDAMESANDTYRDAHAVFEEAEDRQRELADDRTARIEKLNKAREKVSGLKNPTSTGRDTVYSDLMRAARSLEKLADKAILVK